MNVFFPNFWRRQIPFLNILKTKHGYWPVRAGAVYIYIYIFICIYIYIYIIYTLRQRGVFHLQNKNIRYRAVFKITLNTIILVCLCYPTFLPLIVYIGHWTLVLELENEDQMVTRSWIYSFGSLNNCVNLYIYASRTKRFKKASCRFWCNITYHTSTIN